MTKQELINHPAFKAAPNDAVIVYFPMSVDDGPAMTFDELKNVPNENRLHPSLVPRYLVGHGMTKKELLDNSLFKTMKKDMILTINCCCEILRVFDVEVFVQQRKRGGSLHNYLVLQEYMSNNDEKWVQVEDENSHLVWTELKNVVLDWPYDI